jgi:hypothetical protein
MRVCHQVIVSVQADPVVPLTALPTVHMHGHARPSGLARLLLLSTLPGHYAARLTICVGVLPLARSQSLDTA